MDIRRGMKHQKGLTQPNNIREMQQNKEVTQRNKGLNDSQRRAKIQICPIFMATERVWPGNSDTSWLGVCLLFQGSMSKQTWEGSPRLQRTLPRCTLHLSRTSAVTTEGPQPWWNSWRRGHLFCAKNDNVGACGKRAKEE